MLRPLLCTALLVQSSPALAQSSPGAEVATLASVPTWPPATSPSATVQDLHREYGNIFRHGNRNAASHLWATFLLQRAPQMTWERLYYMFTGFCAVSGSPVRPSDYHRYRMTLPLVTGGDITGFMYYCCWPCVCDTNDFIRVDTLTVTASDGAPRRVHAAVIGDPCRRPEALREPFVQPFYGRGETTLEREAAEVRCNAAGELIGATLSDNGHVVIQLFPLAEGDGVGDKLALPGAEPGVVSQPGRIRQDAASGLRFQDEFEYAAQCEQRERDGFNSGMGEIFRRVAQISPVEIAQLTPALGASDEQLCEEGEGATSNDSATAAAGAAH